jgi:hypothetical protein
MKTDILLSTGRIVSHKPYLSNGVPNGATDAFILQKVTINGVTFEAHKEMTHDEWIEYCKITSNNN